MMARFKKGLGKQMTIETDRMIVAAASISIIVGMWIQAIKIWKTRSAKDFTWALLVSVLFNEIAWIKYGIALNEWPIVVTSGLNLPAVVVAFVGFLKYRNPSGSEGA